MVAAQQRTLLLLSTTATVGGVERIVIAVAAGLTERSWRVRAVFPDWADERFVSWCRGQHVDPELSPYLRQWGGLREGLQTTGNLARLIRAARAPVVNLHYGGGDISLKDVLAVRIAGARRCIVSVHHPVSLREVGSFKRALTYFGAALADAVVVPSRAVAHMLRQAGVPATKLHVIPNGVAIPASLPTQLESRRRLQIDSAPVVIATLARLVPDKQIDHLIRAASALPSTGRPWLLAVAGAGPSQPMLQALAERILPAGRFVFLGHVPDAIDLYRAADLFVLPSSQEGFGLVFVEAAVAGRPSIGSNVGAVPEVISHGRTGLLVPAGDIQALTSAIQRLLEDGVTRETYGRAARERAIAEFSLPTMVDRYETVLARR